MWERAKGYESTFRFSTLFTAHDVREELPTEKKVLSAIHWCKCHGITRVFLEVFRDGYTAEKDQLTRGRDLFQRAGIQVSGCVTPRGMGVISNQESHVSDYEKEKTLEECQRIFEYAATLFDEIMIDAFLFTDDTSASSEKAKGEQSWAEYRCDLMLRVCREAILGPARDVNSQVEMMITYPPWYDRCHERGYNVETQTDLFDQIWGGTGSWSPDGEGRNGKISPSYHVYYNMRWLGDIGKDKAGGGWFSSEGKSPTRYVEHSRQTILGGAREALLFHYGELVRGAGKEDLALLMEEMEAQFMLAEAVAEANPVGILAPKIPNSEPGEEAYIYDYLGMLGLPLVPLSRIDTNYPAALFTTQSIQSDLLYNQLKEFLDEQKPVAITHHLKHYLEQKPGTLSSMVLVLEVPGDLREFYQFDASRLRHLRKTLLQPWGMEIEGPTRVGLYCFDNGIVAVENFRDEEVEFTLRFEAGLEELEKQYARNTFFAFPKESHAKAEVSSQGVEFTLQARALAVIKLSKKRFRED